MQARLFTVLLSRKFGACGEGSVVCPPFRYANLQHVFLSDHVIVNRDSWIHAIEDSDQPGPPELTLGSHVSIGMGATISVVRRIVLGEYVLLARNVYISDHGHAFEDVDVPITLQGVAGVAEVEVGAHSWLGQNVCVMPGVRIGRHCVIGANSVVTRDVPDCCVAVGAPARVRKRYNAGSKRWEKVEPVDIV